MRLALSSLTRPQLLQVLIAVLLVANLVFGAARLVLAADYDGGGNPLNQNMRPHLGCVDKNNGALRAFTTQHEAFGTNPPHDACTPGEIEIGIWFGHN